MFRCNLGHERAPVQDSELWINFSKCGNGTFCFNDKMFYDPVLGTVGNERPISVNDSWNIAKKAACDVKSSQVSLLVVWRENI